MSEKVIVDLTGIRLFNDASISKMIIICVKTQHMYTVYIIAKTMIMVNMCSYMCFTLYSVSVCRDNVPQRFLCSYLRWCRIMFLSSYRSNFRHFYNALSNCRCYSKPNRHTQIPRFRPTCISGYTCMSLQTRQLSAIKQEVASSERKEDRATTHC